MVKLNWCQRHAFWIFTFTNHVNEPVWAKRCSNTCWNERIWFHRKWPSIGRPRSYSLFIESIMVSIIPTHSHQINATIESKFFATGLERTIPQMNNFVVYEGFFDKPQSQNGTATENGGRQMHITAR